MTGMTDWKTLAAARGLAVPDAELERICAVLAGLETAFRPLVKTIPPETEPAPVFACAPEVSR